MVDDAPEMNAGPEPGANVAADEARLIEALRRGDEAAFVTLIDQHYAALLRLARLYVADRAVAEEVVQETWLGLLQGLDRFEGRASLKTWLYRILVNRARTRAQRERRSLPFSALWEAADEPAESALPPERFVAGGPNPGHWAAPVRPWETSPEAAAVSAETRVQIGAAVAGLPPSQREVITLRDIDGWSSDEVCNTLGISETNQRVLLHRARARVRRALEQYLDRK